MNDSPTNDQDRVTHGEEHPPEAPGETGNAPVEAAGETAGTAPGEAAGDPAGRRTARGAGLSDKPEGSSPDQTTAGEEVEGRLTALDFEVHKSIRYHAKRRSFFDKCNNLTRAASAIFAAAAVVSIVGGSHIATAIVAGILAVLSSVDLVIDFSRRARVYDDLYREFCELAAIIEEQSHPTEAQVRTWAAKKLRIQAKEPTSLDVLNVICANEELEGRGYTHKYRIRWWQRPFSHFVSLPPSDFPQVESRVAGITHQP